MKVKTNTQPTYENKIGFNKELLRILDLNLCADCVSANIFVYKTQMFFIDVFISRKVNSKGRSAELYPIFHIEFACLEYVRLICGCIFTHSKHVLRTERK